MPSGGYPEAEVNRDALQESIKARIREYAAMCLGWSSGEQRLFFSDDTFRVTPAVFAYSMLYPYTDNPLDNPEIDEATKRANSERLARRLRGARLEPVDANEHKVFRLVGMIEGQYPRSDFPEVYLGSWPSTVPNAGVSVNTTDSRPTRPTFWASASRRVEARSSRTSISWRAH